MIYSIGTLCIKKYFSMYTRVKFKSNFKFVEEFIAVIKTGFLIFTTVIYMQYARAHVYDVRGKT